MFTTVVVDGAKLASSICVALTVERSAWFEFTPLPDDQYEIKFKSEHKAFVDALLPANEGEPADKHTPGPWEYDRMLLPPNTKDRRCGFVVNGPDKPDDDLPTRICDLRVPRGVSGFAEGEANARLIAAAPELLVALMDAYKFIDALPRPNVRKDFSRLNHLEHALRAARTAIAKATMQLPERIISDAQAYAGAGHFEHHQD